MLEDDLWPFLGTSFNGIQLFHGLQKNPWHFRIFSFGLLLLSEDTVKYSHVANLRDKSGWMQNLTTDEMSRSF
jgi:hypothetical protein